MKGGVADTTVEPEAGVVDQIKTDNNSNNSVKESGTEVILLHERDNLEEDRNGGEEGRSRRGDRVSPGRRMATSITRRLFRRRSKNNNKQQKKNKSGDHETTSKSSSGSKSKKNHKGIKDKNHTISETASEAEVSLDLLNEYPTNHDSSQSMGVVLPPYNTGDVPSSGFSYNGRYPSLSSSRRTRLYGYGGPAYLPYGGIPQTIAEGSVVESAISDFNNSPSRMTLAERKQSLRQFLKYQHFLAAANMASKASGKPGGVNSRAGEGSTAVASQANKSISGVSRKSIRSGSGSTRNHQNKKPNNPCSGWCWDKCCRGQGMQQFPGFCCIPKIICLEGKYCICIY